MIWHVLTDLVSMTAFCRHCGVPCSRFDRQETTYFHFPNLRCKNANVLFHNKEEDVWVILDAGKEYSRIANELFRTHLGPGREPYGNPPDLGEP